MLETDHSNVTVRSIAAFALGGLLVLAAVQIENGTIERALTGEAAGQLQWGPGLFRVLLAVNGALLIALGFRWIRSRATEPPAPAWQPLGARYWTALGALTVVGLGLRLYHLNSCLWFDEVLTLLDFARPPATTIITSFPSQNQHMLYSLMAHGCFRLFGESAWAMRLPAVFFGLASIWALFFLARRLLGAPAALVAAALMTFSYHHVWFSQNARGYTGLLFSATLATWLWLEALDRKAWRWWIAYAAALFVGFAIHVTVAFVAAAHGILWLLMRLRPHWGALPGQTVNRETLAGWRPIAAWALCGLEVLQLYALAAPEFLRSAIHEVSLPSEWLNPMWVVREFLRAFTNAWFGPIAILLAAVFLGAGYLGLLRKDWRAALLMVLPPLLGGSLMLALAHNLWPRFFFFAMGFGILVVIEGALAVTRWVFRPARAQRWGLIAAGLMVAASAATLPRCYALPKQDFTGARDGVERARRPEDGVMAVGLAGRAYREYFAPAWQAPSTAAELEKLRRASYESWLVYTIPIEVKAYHPDLWRMVENNYEVVQVFRGTLNGGEVYVCRSKPDQKPHVAAISEGQHEER